VQRGGAPGVHGVRPWTPLALTLGLHLLLVLAWLTGARGNLARDPAGKPPPRASVFVPVRPASQPTPAPAPPPALPMRLRPPASIGAPAVPAVALPAPLAQTPDDSPPSPAPAPPTAPQDPARLAVPGDLLASSKAMAGRVDRELRKGAGVITAEPDRKWERFAEAFAAARTGATRAVTLDSYTEPDGVIVYRKTVGDRVSCYRSGSVGGLATRFGVADGHGAGTTSCPTGVSWTRH
jgi:hypothetical protein